MTVDIEATAERHIRKAGEASRAGNSKLWVAALYAADVVGKYRKYGTRTIADETGRKPSTVENWAHAAWMFDYFRKFGVASEARKLRRVLTITHFSTMWEMQKKYSLNHAACLWYMTQMIAYRAEGKSWSADTLRQEVENTENKSGKVQTWESIRDSFYNLLLRVSVVNMPEDVRSLVYGLINKLEAR